jgi:hypothetical protein
MLVSFDYKEQEQASRTKCFQRFNFEKNEVSMQDAKAQVVVNIYVRKAIKASAGRVHVFSVGTSVIAVPHPKPLVHLEDLRTQGLHTDGPRKYRSMQFDAAGNVKADAPASAAEDTVIPPKVLHGPDASTSVLLAFFKHTFLGIPSKSDSGRISSMESVAVPQAVPLGTGAAFLFDTFHQV